MGRVGAKGEGLHGTSPTQTTERYVIPQVSPLRFPNANDKEHWVLGNLSSEC